MRLQKFLSRAGVASRRAAEELIRAGRVRVNGEPVRELGVKVVPSRDRVEVDGRRVEPAKPLWIALHKPRGYVSTRRDPGGRPTIYDLLPDEHRSLFHVGRLDADSEGLLLLTNQGDVANRLLHPRHGAARVYDVELEGRPSTAELGRLERGVALDDGPARAESVQRRRPSPEGGSRVRLTMREGRKREVRRMFDALGYPVRRLVRIRFGPVELGRLRTGEWRELGPAETASLGRVERKR